MVYIVMCHQGGAVFAAIPSKAVFPGGGHSLIRSDRYVPLVRAGFRTRNFLKAGMNIDSNKVKTGLKAKIAEFSTVKTGF